jgi:tryptophan-rich sensory protein
MATLGSTRESPIVPWLVLGLLLAICLGAAGLGAAWTTPALDDWYACLSKPSWTPPDWVFGPVWTVLYAMMAVAAWLVWRTPSSGRWPALVLFGAQLLFNAAWSYLFFGLHDPGLAFADIVVLWCAILATILAFEWISAPAAALLLPYLLWVSFATVLNGAIWRMNP